MNPIRTHSNRGSALLLVLCFAVVLAISFSGILGYLNYQSSLDWRSHYWNQSLHLAEAGIDMGYEELTLRYPDGQGFKTGRGWSTNSVSGTYLKTTTLTNAAGQVVGTISITVSGVGGDAQIQAVGTCTPPFYGPTVSRAVRVTVTQGEQGFAFLCRDFMKLTGTKTYVDSYDSTDSSKSTGGLYDAAKALPYGDCGVLGGLFQLSASGTAAIYGKVWTTPSGTFTMGSNSSVGDTFDAAQRAYNVPSGEAKGYVRHDLTGSLPDVTLPAGLSSATLLSDISSTMTLSNGDYRVNKIALSSGDTLSFQGTVRLYVMNTVQVSGTGSMVVENASSVEIYAASKWGLSGKGIINKSGSPTKCRIYGLTSCTEIAMSGSSALYAWVYAPEADIKISGGGSDFHGAIQAASITSSGSVVFHYDESLSGSGSTGIACWQELRNVGGSWVP